jgi:DNA-directed RNA polymerase subunit L
LERYKKLKHDRNVREIKDFIPYKVAKRVKDAINFSVRLDGRAPNMNLDEATKKMLKRYDHICYPKNETEEDLKI